MSRVLNLLVSHAGPEDVDWSAQIWSAVAPADQLLVAYGGPRDAFGAIQHPHRLYVDDPRLRTIDHQRQRQSFGAVFRVAEEWMGPQEFTHVYCAEYDHIPLVRDLHERLIGRLAGEAADVLGHELHRVDGSNAAPYLNHVIDPRFAAYWESISVRKEKGVILNMFGSGSVWTRRAFAAVALTPEPFPIYLELFLPTLAHHLGFRIRPFLDQDRFVSSIGDRHTEIEAAKAAGAWTIHPVKSRFPVDRILPPAPGPVRSQGSQSKGPPLISLCIPTYGRPGPLADLLASLAEQLSDEVEVVISEDPSGTDETRSVVERFRARIPVLRYSRNESRLKFDRNLLHLLGLARGEYCWLLGDDDIVEPGGLARALRALRERGPLTGMTVDRKNYDRELKHPLHNRPFRQRETRLFTDVDEMFLRLLDQIGFLSCQIVRRELCAKVMAQPEVEAFVGSGYVQLFIIMRMMAEDRRWLYLAEPCVGWRADNDSFEERGQIGRLRMDIEAYERVAEAVFGRDSATFRLAMADIARTHVRHHIVHAKLNGASWNYSRDAITLCHGHYSGYPSYWLKTFPLLILPRSIVRAGRSGYHFLARSRRP